MTGNGSCEYIYIYIYIYIYVCVYVQKSLFYGLHKIFVILSCGCCCLFLCVLLYFCLDLLGFIFTVLAHLAKDFWQITTTKNLWLHIFIIFFFFFFFVGLFFPFIICNKYKDFFLLKNKLKKIQTWKHLNNEPTNQIQTIILWQKDNAIINIFMNYCYPLNSIVLFSNYKFIIILVNKCSIKKMFFQILFFNS